ncbi:glycosyltransferase family 2 protein [Streptosporangium soli]|nr:glycosyltransferase [Streptosporangium sp. KLBMP 9127]
MGVKVSVIMPVRNPGGGADAGIRSLLEQSLPPDEYEVIFADDGSADGTAERLDVIASTRPNVRILHLEPTGSPMRGRNAGLAAAVGEYVYLLDQHDRLDREALHRMHARAVAAEADVLVGKLVRDNGAPATAFYANRERADILRDRLLTQLTPHKLFRKAFLDAHGLRFAEHSGPLAEQAFVMQAYLAAKVVAVLADHVCCRVGERRRSSQEPAATARELRALLDVIDRHTQPGRQRDRIYAHWLRAAVLRPFIGARFVSSSQDRAVLYRAMRELALERFPTRLDPMLPVHLRAVAALLRAGRLDQLVILAGLSRGTGLRAHLDEVRWDDGVLTLAIDAEIVGPDGRPITFTAEDDRLYWRPPLPIADSVLCPSLTDVTEDVAMARLNVYLRHTESGATHVLPATSEIVSRGEGRDARVQLVGDVRLDVGTAAGGHPLPRGLWEVHVRLYSGAYQARTRIGRVRKPLNCVGVVADHPRRLVVPCWTDDGELGVCVEPKSFAESIALVSLGASTARRDGHVFIVVPVPYVPPSGGPPVELTLRNGSREICVPGLVEPGIPGKMAGQLVAKVPMRRMPAAGYLGPGTWVPSLRTDGREVGLRFELEMHRGRRIMVRPSVAVEPALEPRRSVFHRAAAQVPGARHLVRLARAGKSRYRL